jgi:hypothetical protein
LIRISALSGDPTVYSSDCGSTSVASTTSSASASPSAAAVTEISAEVAPIGMVTDVLAV